MLLRFVRQFYGCQRWPQPRHNPLFSLHMSFVVRDQGQISPIGDRLAIPDHAAGSIPAISIWHLFHFGHRRGYSTANAGSKTFAPPLIPHQDRLPPSGFRQHRPSRHHCQQYPAHFAILYNRQAANSWQSPPKLTSAPRREAARITRLHHPAEKQHRNDPPAKALERDRPEIRDVHNYARTQCDLSGLMPHAGYCGRQIDDLSMFQALQAGQ